MWETQSAEVVKFEPCNGDAVLLCVGLMVCSVSRLGGTFPQEMRYEYVEYGE